MLIPNYEQVPNVNNIAGLRCASAVCHGTSTRSHSAFAVAFQQAGYTFTIDLCKADTDKDGQTNGEELGDPCCVWEFGDTPQRTTQISDPSIAASKSSATKPNCSAPPAPTDAGAGGPSGSPPITPTDAAVVSVSDSGRPTDLEEVGGEDPQAYSEGCTLSVRARANHYVDLLWVALIAMRLRRRYQSKP